MKVEAVSFQKNTPSRNALLKKNILFSSVLKAGSVLITLILVPLTIGWIDPVQYGIWLTISSLITWLNNFDLGISNGLKNQIAHSIALNDESAVRKLVSSTYAILTIISVLIFLVISLCMSFFNWNKVLNISGSSTGDLYPVILILLGLFCFQFVLQIVNTVLMATHQVYISSVIMFCGQLLALAGVYFLSVYTSPDFKLLVWVMASSPVIVLIIGSFYLYQGRLKKFSPSFYHTDLGAARKIMNVGRDFFILQIGSLMLFQTDNIIITRILGPEAVTSFNIAFRLFSVVTMVFVIIITPYWSAFTDAYAKNDFEWIKASMYRVQKIWLLLILFALLLLIFSGFIYGIWIKEAVTIPVILSASMFVYVVIHMWQTMYVYFLNGVGKIRLQLTLFIIAAAINIPLAVFLGKTWGLPGIISANSVVFLIMGTLFYVQFKKIVSGKAVKIWNR